MEHEKELTLYEHVTTFMDMETNATKLICYGVPSIALLSALWKIRPFSQFKQPYDIPRHFINMRVPLQGTVVHIEPTQDALVMVRHKPLISLGFSSSKKYLPLKLAGINVTSNGVNWLQHILVGKRIKFIPLSTQGDYVDCVVTMEEGDMEPLKIGEELMKLGFGTTSQLQKNLLSEKYILKYQERLHSAQKYAERRRNGDWHFRKDSSKLWRIQEFVKKKVLFLLPSFVVKQTNF